MASGTASRSSRRAVTRRKLIVESSDEEEIPHAKTEEEEDDFTTPPKRSPRKVPQSRRKAANDAPETSRTATRSVARGKKVIPDENIEPANLFDPETSIQPAIELLPKKASPQKRKTTPARASRISPAPSTDSPLSAPQPSVTQEPFESHIAPLTDITASHNERPRSAEFQTPPIDSMKPSDTTPEKPLDIVLKSRSMVAPIVESSGPKPRIVITYLILTNFKSYAGRQEVGPFHASFSAVVGPNGSGKSNVIDSLLFVFGFRASKMRQGKISALIHNSAAYPNLDYCEVAVHFREIMDQMGPMK
ncbi:RecF/RecN/SMC N terminal domain-containing protein [Xylogone sp. PMI_703]|nr:RecF/RecN/SMC N terminal domain-containing protein [Xylogone sp. PMI_703]